MISSEYQTLRQKGLESCLSRELRFPRSTHGACHLATYTNPRGNREPKKNTQTASPLGQPFLPRIRTCLLMAFSSFLRFSQGFPLQGLAFRGVFLLIADPLKKESSTRGSTNCPQKRGKKTPLTFCGFLLFRPFSARLLSAPSEPFLLDLGLILIPA